MSSDPTDPTTTASIILALATTKPISNGDDEVDKMLDNIIEFAEVGFPAHRLQSPRDPPEFIVRIVPEVDPPDDAPEGRVVVAVISVIDDRHGEMFRLMGPYERVNEEDDKRQLWEALKAIEQRFLLEAELKLEEGNLERAEAELEEHNLALEKEKERREADSE